MKKISAEIVADSINPQGDRITTMLLTYPRFIHGEVLTHRVFSKNSASSRAIPFHKMVEMVETDPFIPIAWQKDHKGMQGSEYITNPEHIDECNRDWLEARNHAIESAQRLNKGFPIFEDNQIVNWSDDVTKQLCNRLLEPFMWHTVLLTGTEFKNFFELRCPKYIFGVNTNKPKIWKSRKDAIKDFPDWETNNDLFWNTMNYSQAEIHMQALAEAMWDAYNESTPKELKAGEWHIPFGDKIDSNVTKWFSDTEIQAKWLGKDMILLWIKVATARCARLSYMTFDGEIDYEKDVKLHDTLLESHHMSPFEHCARAMSDEEYYTFIKGKSNANWDTDLVTDNTYEISAQFDHNVLGWCNNFKGFVQYRYLIENHYDGKEYEVQEDALGEILDKKLQGLLP